MANFHSRWCLPDLYGVPNCPCCTPKLEKVNSEKGQFNTSWQKMKSWVNGKNRILVLGHWWNPPDPSFCGKFRLLPVLRLCFGTRSFLVLLRRNSAGEGPCFPWLLSICSHPLSAVVQWGSLPWTLYGVRLLSLPSVGKEGSCHIMPCHCVILPVLEPPESQPALCLPKSSVTGFSVISKCDDCI